MAYNIKTLKNMYSSVESSNRKAFETGDAEHIIDSALEAICIGEGSDINKINKDYKIAVTDGLADLADQVLRINKIYKADSIQGAKEIYKLVDTVIKKYIETYAAEFGTVKLTKEEEKEIIERNKKAINAKQNMQEMIAQRIEEKTK